MKKFLILIMVLALIFATDVLADDIAVEIDGKKLQFDVSPTIIDGRTIIPARAIFESLGLEVKWDEATRTVPNSKTQVPSHYKYTYTVFGNVIVDEFDNINPDDYSPSTSVTDLTIPQILEGDFNLESLLDGVDLDINIADIKNLGIGLLWTFMTNTRGLFQ